MMTVERLMESLEKFVNVLETWRKLVEDYRPSETTSEGSSDMEPPPFGGNGFMAV